MTFLDVVRLIVGSPAGSFGLVVSFVIFSIWVYTKILGVIHEHSTFEKRCSKLETDIESIRVDVIYIKGMMNQLINRNGKDEMMQAHSPLALTEKGIETANGMNAEAMIASNWESKILPAMNRDLENKNPYDIQQYCLERVPVFPETFFSQEDLNRIKLYAFQKGHPLFSCLKVLGLLIRDKYLKVHNIEVAEIDKHSPTL